MSRDMLLAADIIARLLRPGAFDGDAEDAAFRLAGIEERLRSSKGDRLHLMADDVPVSAGDLPPEGWIWLLENLSEQDSEPSDQVLDELYEGYPDRLLRLRLVDASLAHPAIGERYAGVIGALRERRRLPLSQLPPSWPRNWLLAQISPDTEHAAGTPFEDRAGAIAEMSLYLVQVGSEEAFAILAALRRETSEITGPARQHIENIIRNSIEAGAPWNEIPGFG
jgi:hypothetical protein